MVVPFSLDANGSVNSTADPNLQVQQHITSLVATGPGERVMLPTYGVPVRNTIFAPDDQMQVAILQGQISSAMGTWEPNVDLSGVSLMTDTDPSTGFVGLNVDWIPRTPFSGTGTGVQTAVILVGGTVIES